MKRGGTVYFIRGVGTRGPVKIGCSSDPAARCRAMSNGSPVVLEIVALIPGGMDIERRFHGLFQGSHERTEWFSWSPDLEATIGAINAGTFDASTLPGPAIVAGMIGGKGAKRSVDQRIQFSYSSRAWRTEQRTGYKPPVEISGIVARGDPDEILNAERYFARPDIFGIAPAHSMNLAGLIHRRRGGRLPPPAAPHHPGPLIERTSAAAPRPILRHFGGVNRAPGRTHYTALKGGNCRFHTGSYAG
jgi:hypothetical protein